MKNTFIAAFGALYFFVWAKFFKYRLMSKRFFGVEFKFWVSKSVVCFQFILVKKTKRACTTSYGNKCIFSFCNLYKSLKYQLSQVE